MTIFKYSAVFSASICALFLSSASFAQTSNNTDSSVQAEANDEKSADGPDVSPISETPLVDEALKVPPTQRSVKGLELAQNPDALAQIDLWIKNTPVDDPQNLKLKDFLMAMPVSVAGDRLVELAKKTNTPAVQESWMRWLSKYPDPYASVVRAWMKPLNPNSAQFLALLRIYYELNPNDAVDVWTQLIRSHSISELGETASFGHNIPSCRQALAHQIVQTWHNIQLTDAQNFSADTPEILRLVRAYSKCSSNDDAQAAALTCAQRRELAANRDDSASFNGFDEETTSALSEIIDQLLNAGVSRRITAIDFAAGWISKQPKLIEIYKNAKNTTEKAHALRALHGPCDEKQPERVLNALQKGDETLRAEAASIIVDYPYDFIPQDVLSSAFNKEIWTDTQISLYQALKRSTKDNNTAWMHSIFMDANRAESIRLTAMHDLIETDQSSITLGDMETLIKSEAPLELIASVSELLYSTQPETRPTLRTWIQAQQPFNRRLLATFARFVNIDANEKDASSIELMRTICSKTTEQENILQPCLHYMTDNAQSDEDRELAEKLQQRMTQYEAMTNLDLGF